MIISTTELQDMLRQVGLDIAEAYKAASMAERVGGEREQGEALSLADHRLNRAKNRIDEAVIEIAVILDRAEQARQH